MSEPTAPGGYDGARVVVTGSAGFIGTHLVRVLDAAGAAVTGVDRRPPPVGSPGAHLHLDLLAPIGQPVLTDVLRAADVVFHLAAVPGVRGSGPELEASRVRDNVDAGARVLALTPPSTLVVVASSSSVYGGARRDRHGIRPSSEADPLRPRGGYARSKAALEERCARRRAGGGRVSVVRPFTVAGEGQRADMAIARWLWAAALDRPLPVYGSLTRSRDVTDVVDVVRGLLGVGAHPQDTTVNLGTGRGRSLAEIIDAVAAAVGRPVELRLTGAGSEEPPVTLADPTRAREQLGVTLATDLRALVARQARAMAPAVALVA